MEIASGSSCTKILTLVLLVVSTWHAQKGCTVLSCHPPHSLVFSTVKAGKSHSLFLELCFLYKTGTHDFFSLPSREGRREDREENGERERKRVYSCSDSSVIAHCGPSAAGADLLLQAMSFLCSFLFVWFMLQLFLSFISPIPLHSEFRSLILKVFFLKKCFMKSEMPFPLSDISRNAITQRCSSRNLDTPIT